MPIPGFLQSTQVSMGALAPVGTPGGPPGRGMGPPAGGGPQSGMIVFVVENQLQTNWCWTAVTTSVSRFFSTASTWTQCRVCYLYTSQREQRGVIPTLVVSRSYEASVSLNTYSVTHWYYTPCEDVYK